MERPEDDVIPIGGRLGSERLYDEHLPPLPPPQPEPVVKPRGKRRKAAKPPPHPPRERPPAGESKAPNWREIGSNTLEIAGIMAITVGSWLIAAWLGLIVLGLCLILLGVATGIQRSA
jgi:hypothetical protein